MDIDAWLEKNGNKLGTEYERMFVKEVLSQIAEIDLAVLEAQYPFKDRLGLQRYCDFALIEGDAIKIAIEIDGYDKRGRGGMNMREFIDWLWRQNGLAHNGWIVLRFANVDVRDKPGRCAEHLRLLLRQERSKAGVVEAYRKKAEELRDKIKKLDRTARKAAEEAGIYITRVKKSEAARRTEQDKVHKLEQKLEALERQTKVAAHAQELDNDEKRELETLNEEQSITVSDVLAMKFAIGAFTIVIISAMALIAYLVMNQPVGTPPTAKVTTEPREESTLTPVGESCDNPVPWSTARDFLGRTIAVQGSVAAITTRNDVTGRPTWIEIGEAFPDPDRIVLVIWGQNRAGLSGILARISTGNTVCAQGMISEFRDVLQIELESPEQLRIQ